ncbi:MAG: putative metal-dependent hydrolase [Bacteroidia bacterium]|nr:putative metal-dependent hydrolase [Bacteroidia bacterium]MBT8278261.1 putative metal-dependent hydrolase [Bacteroidia bacterium]NND26831.1 putative metal-dependent hydrolase [Flavobacteriaceae bacterium]NNK59101.1 putative metal-dependent hydrolase [Flavobacteriaceae bacterium]NNL31667.1 putative metal-dependent hydrolase [Flavobacteriaceae bacterium]
MNDENLELLRYPIGKFQCPEHITNTHLKEWIDVLEHFPMKLDDLVRSLTVEQLDTPYRQEGWTVRQVVHHLSDSHHHSYIRFKWALTEDTPIIKYYHEKEWAELEDAKHAPIQMSIDHLKAVHFKLVYLLKSLTEEQLNKCFIHPEHNNTVSLKENIGKYAWHSNHHYHHIKNLLLRKGWLK